MREKSISLTLIKKKDDLTSGKKNYKYLNKEKKRNENE